ncbi:MAG TPA: TolC family protein [Turneriella sp.]|nr:TolC family protein [Turneriella sp.]
MRYLIFVLLLTSPLLSQESEYYLNLALQNNARLAAERQLASAAQSDHARESMFLENPELMLGLMNVPVNTFPALNRDSMSNFSVGITQRIALPWEAHYRKAAAELRATTSGLNLELQQAALRYEVMEKLNAIRFYIEREKNLSDAKKLISATMRILAVPRKEARNTAGAILEARAALATAENDLLNNTYELEKAWLDLEALCGTKLNRAEGAGILAAWDKVSATSAEPASDLKKSLIYRKAEGEVRAQQAMLSLSRSALFPEVKVSAAYMFRQSVPGSSMAEDMVAVSASTPLPVFYPLKNKHEVDGQEKRLQAAERMLTDTERQLEAQVAAETVRLKTLLASAENYARAILPAHSSAHRSHLANINLMGGSAAEALIAYRMYLTAGEERLRQIREAHSALFKIEYLRAQGAHNQESK